MDLKQKYDSLISYASQPRVQDLAVREENNVLHISGKAPKTVKDRLWDMYNSIDPDMRAGDMVLDIQEENGNDTTSQTYEIKAGDNLSKIAQKYPNMTWQKIADANKDTITDPNKIYPGQKIRIPL